MLVPSSWQYRTVEATLSLFIGVNSMPLCLELAKEGNLESSIQPDVGDVIANLLTRLIFEALGSSKRR